MANSHSCVIEADGDADELSRFYRALLLTGGDPQTLLSPVPDAGLDNNFSLSSPGQRPVTVSFECYGRLPDELVRSVSKLFPTLVFALLFLDEMSCRVGFVIYRNGEAHSSAINRDVARATDRDRNPEACEAEALHPEAATIDGHEAVDWASRLSQALSVVSREAAVEVGLGDDLHELETFADKVEELGPEYEHATTPLGSSRRFLDELCEQASQLEAFVACRLAVREALGNPVKVGGSGQGSQAGRVDLPAHRA